MKKINRYAVLRIPTSIDYEYSVNTRKRTKKWELYRRRHIKRMENIKNKKLSVICYVTDGKLAIKCPLCHNIINTSNIGSRRHGRCETCGCIYDKESNVAMKYYRRYLPKVYQEIEVRRLSNKNARNRFKMKHQKEQEDSYLKKVYPLITVWNKDGKEEIITNITKEIKESAELSSSQKDVLIRLQIPAEKYRLLQKLGVDLVMSISDSVDEGLEKCNNQKRGDLR